MINLKNKDMQKIIFYSRKGYFEGKAQITERTNNLT